MSTNLCTKTKKGKTMTQEKNIEKHEFGSDTGSNGHQGSGTSELETY